MPAQDSEPLLPPSLIKAMRRAPLKGGLKAVRHVVFLMQENRSFDHYFGSGFAGVRGLADRNAITLPDGHSVYDQPDPHDPAKRHSPFRLDIPQSEKDQGTSHDWVSTHQAWHDGWHDRWILAKGTGTMGFYDQVGEIGKDDVVGTYRELADAFTICDAYHSSVPGETTSNRNYLFTGFGGWEPDGRRAIGPYAHDRETAGDPAGYNWTSYAELLEAHGKSWKVYQEWDNFYDNNLEFHGEFKRVALAALKAAGLDSKYKNMFQYGASCSGREGPAPEEVAALAEAVRSLSPADRSLYHRGLFRSPPTPRKPGGYRTRGFVEAFAADIANGAVPAVSYLVAGERDSEHPGNSTPMLGQEIVREVLDAIASNDDMWDSTVLFISYDENDGLFDHVPPPVPPREAADEFVDNQPMGLGMRVPLITVSPWTVGGYVNSQVFDHTSQVRFLENWLGVRQPAISRWRRTVSGDLMSVFDFDRTTAPPPRPADGTRRLARPLPYQPDAYGTLDTEARRFFLRMGNSGPASAHLALYPYGGEYDIPQHFDVLGTSVEAVPVEGDGYDLTLTGPNGFRREFAGTLTGRAVAVDVTSSVDPVARQLHVQVTSRGTEPLTATLKPLAYSQASPLQQPLDPGKTATLVWKTDDAHAWYDIALTIDQDTTYRRRLMGHIESGHESISG
jgi:phospholipase C